MKILSLYCIGSANTRKWLSDNNSLSHKECPIHTVREEEEIKKHASKDKRVYIEMSKGEVILLKIKLLHSSLVNTINRPRRAFSIAFIDGNTYCTTSGARYPQVLPEYRPV